MRPARSSPTRFAGKLTKVGWRGDLRVVDLHACFGVKDPSDLHMRAPEQFKDAWARAQALAAPFTRAQTATDLWPQFETDRDAVDVSEIHLPKLTEQAIKALVAANETPVLFRQLGRVVRVDLDEEQRPIIKLVGNEVMRHAMARATDWVKTRGSGKRASRANVEQPKVVVENVLATPELPFPGLRGIAASPFFTRSGELVVSKGYDPASRLFLALDDAVEIPNVPIAPTQDDVRAAVSTNRRSTARLRSSDVRTV